MPTKKPIKLFLSISILFLTQYTYATLVTNESTSVIYGKDNRYEVDNYPLNRFKEKANSIAMRVPNRKLVKADTNLNLNFLKVPLNKFMSDLCPNERFIDQYALGDCSAFLISKNKLLTAGHCMFSEIECQNYSWVFDFKEGTEQIKKSNVYKCKSIVVQKFEYTDEVIKDYAVIELDRDTDRKPLHLRSFGRPMIGEPLVVIGHPIGLPMKIGDGANVKLPNEGELEDIWASLKLRKYYFTTNTDTYSGNSGSPVFNKITGSVEGILIQGADDFVYDETKDCMQSRHNSNSHKNAYEKVLRVTQIPELVEILKSNDNDGL
jgi:V8-like Glu-specific endopeptidase